MANWMQWGAATIILGANPDGTMPLWTSPARRDWQQVAAADIWYTTYLGRQHPATLSCTVRCATQADYYALLEEQKNVHRLDGRSCAITVEGEPRSFCGDDQVEVAVRFEEVKY